jgi:hypothetical protein
MSQAKRLLAVLSTVLCLEVPVGAGERDLRIQLAIDRGVAFLKTQQSQEGMWSFSGDEDKSNIGATALAALSLLECGVSEDDPAVQRAARYIRRFVPTLDHTYSLAAAIWFFDRLGEDRDEALIQSMGARLMAGQNESGGWTYSCPTGGKMQEQWLTELIKQHDAKKRDPADKERRRNADQGDKNEPRRLPFEIQEQLRLLRLGAKPPVAIAAPGAIRMVADNSNTQFATLALWVARRHGLPVDSALTQVEKRFSFTQQLDGGWIYRPDIRPPAPSPAMTCAGLTGLAVSHGAGIERAKLRPGAKANDPGKNESIKAGLRNLGAVLKRLKQIHEINDPTRREFYFLWSLERVAEIYSLKTIGGTDWYAWGSDLLLDMQKADGSWGGAYWHGGVDTSFALLFLVRSNVAKDLSVILEGRVRDPEMRTLKAVRGKAQNGKKAEQTPESKAPDSPDVPELLDPKEKLDSQQVEGDATQAARKLSEELVVASETQLDQLLTEYKNSKGAVFTLGLARAIPRLSRDSKTKARDALAERLTRMTADTLRTMLKDADPEIRRASSLACAMKDEKKIVPDLIPLLDDSEEFVSRAAHAALKSLSGQDFGPAKNASPKDRGQAMEAWKVWWRKQQEN